MPTRFTLPALAVALLTGFAVRAAEPAAVKAVALPVSGFDFALNPESGALAVAVPEGNEVVLFPNVLADRVASAPVTAKVGPLPVSVAYKKLPKQSVFLVACLAGREMYVLDARTLELVKKVPISSDSAWSVAGSANPADKYAYYCSGRIQDGRVGCVNLDTFADEGMVGDGFLGGAFEAVVAPDGSRLYTRSLTLVTGVQVTDLARGATGKIAPPRRTNNDPNMGGGCVTDPNGGFVAAGESAYTPDMKKRLDALPFAPQLVMESRPLMLSARDDKLSVASTNTFKSVGSATLPIAVPEPPVNPAARLARPPAAAANPKAPAPKPLEAGNTIPATDARRLVYQTKILEHAATKVVLVCYDKTVCVVPPKALDVPDEPFVAVRVEGPTELAVGRPTTWKVVPKDDRVKVELKSGPTGAALDGQRLTWTPGEANVGNHAMVLSYGNGGVTKTRELTVQVRRPSITLSFTPSDLRVSPDGGSAVVIGIEPITSITTPPLHDQAIRVAVIDLSKPEVVAEKKLPGGLTRVAGIDAHHVYVAAGGGAFVVLSRKDLSETRRLFSTSPVRDFVPVADRLLFVHCDLGVNVFKVPALEQADPDDVGIGIHLSAKGRLTSTVLPRWTGDGWWLDGCLYDADLKKVRACLQPAGFWSAAVQAPITPGQPAGLASVSPWGAWASFNGFFQGRRLVGTVQPGGTTTLGRSSSTDVLPDQPAVVAVRSSMSSGAGGVKSRRELVFHELLGGSLGYQLPLEDDEDATRVAGVQPGRVEVRAGKIVAQAGNRVFSVDVPKLDPKKFPAPLHFAADRPVSVVAGKNVTVDLPAVSGAADRVDYGLRQAVPGVEIDKATGKLTLRAETLRAHALTAGARAATQSRDAVTGWLMPADMAVTEYVERSGPRFERLTGAKPTGVPVWVNLGVTALDKNLQPAETDLGVFVEVPQDALRAKAKEFAAQTPTGNAPNPPAGQDQMQRRMAELERKIDLLNDKIDKLTQQLQDPKRPAEDKKK
jgi:hypothetical protein